jgi:hypothetical protein
MPAIFLDIMQCQEGFSVTTWRMSLTVDGKKSPHLPEGFRRLPMSRRNFFSIGQQFTLEFE